MLKTTKMYLFIRKHKYDILIAFIIFLLLFAWSKICFNPIVGSMEKIKKLNTTTANFVVFGESQLPGDCFYNFNGECYLIPQGKEISFSADVLMTCEGKVYENNCFEFSDPLATNECAISQNLLEKLNLKIGDDIEILGEGAVYQIKQILPAQSGIDEKYNHEGIIILHYSQQLVSKHYHTYLSFCDSVDGLLNVKTFIDISVSKDQAVKSIALNFVVFVLCFAGIILVIETTTKGTSSRILKYNVTKLAMTKGNNFKLLLGKNLFKYLFPVVVVCGLSIAGNTIYILSSLLLSGILCLLCFIFVCITAIIVITQNAKENL